MNKQEFYRITFGYADSKYYQQAVELAHLAYQHKTLGKERNIWHIATFTDNEDQIDLMAQLWRYAKHLPKHPELYGIEAWSLELYLNKKKKDRFSYLFKGKLDRYKNSIKQLRKDFGISSDKILLEKIRTHFLNPVKEYFLPVLHRLEKEGYLLEGVGGGHIEGKKKPREHIKNYQTIKDLIDNKKYKQAIQKYYKLLGNNFYNSELHDELIYLKRIADVPFEGRDLLFLKTQSSQSDLIKNNPLEYTRCLDKVIHNNKKLGIKSPLNIIKDYAPLIKELIDKKKKKIILSKKGLDRFEDVSPSSFSIEYDYVEQGRFFEGFPNQIKFCGISSTSTEDKSINRVWIEFSPDYIKKEVGDKNLILTHIEYYQRVDWGEVWRAQEKREKTNRIPDFTEANSLGQIKDGFVWISDLKFTGRQHIIESKKFYEADLIRIGEQKEYSSDNEFTELIDDILREGENLLRERHGLPRIGEGWISEIELFNLVKKIFTDALLHANPKWIKPQHLDIFIASKKLAFEYQGKQHFEPVDFFGGEEALMLSKKRDASKRKKCKQNRVQLIYWRYDEKITRSNLFQKLEVAGVIKK